MATTIKMAVSPGGPTIFSSCWTQKRPCLPPGLNTRPPKMGVRNLADVTEHHTMTKAMPKNHFQRLTLYACMSCSDTIKMNAGMRKADRPKLTVISLYDRIAPMEPQ